MSSGGISGYQSGSATRAQSSRGNSSLSSSRRRRQGAEAVEGEGADVVVADEEDKPERNRRMDMRFLKQVVLLAVLGLVILFAPACNKAPEQTKFATPDEAAAAVLQAFKTEDMGKIQAIFGREGMEAAASGDPVADRHDREVLALAMEQSWRWSPHGADGKELIIGDEQWPFPVPLVKTGNEWQFDSEAGKEEVLARRIGGNELGVIDVCRDLCRHAKGICQSTARRQTSGPLCSTLSELSRPPGWSLLAEETWGKEQPAR